MTEAIRHLRSAASEIGLLGRNMLSVLLPPLCVVCESTLSSSYQWLCAQCLIELASTVRPRTRIVRFDDGGPLTVRFAVDYTPLVSRLITEMKYSDRPGLADFLARLLYAALGDLAARDTVLVPVPMHSSRRRERGFNQSELLASALARVTNLPCRTDVLIKRKDTPSQTALEKTARLGNIIGSIERKPASWSGSAKVVIVDDVATTGSTLKECAQAIAGPEVEEISACVIASSS
jgi:ComF family protein